jgi:hypothetical protein
MPSSLRTGSAIALDRRFPPEALQLDKQKWADHRANDVATHGALTQGISPSQQPLCSLKVDARASPTKANPLCHARLPDATEHATVGTLTRACTPCPRVAAPRADALHT